jgi:integrase
MDKLNTQWQLKDGSNTSTVDFSVVQTNFVTAAEPPFRITRSLTWNANTRAPSVGRTMLLSRSPAGPTGRSPAAKRARRRGPEGRPNPLPPMRLRPRPRSKSGGKLLRGTPMPLLDQVRDALRVRTYSYQTEQTYLHWVERFVRFHKGPGGRRHPKDMGAKEVEAFLTYLAVEHQVAAATTQNVAFNALVFIYRHVLRIDLGLVNALRARRPPRLPTVLTRPEVRQLLDALDAAEGAEPFPLMSRLLYGCGLRLIGGCRVRVKDVDLGRGQLLVRAGKGDKDRAVMLPLVTREPLSARLAWRAELHRRDLTRGFGRVELPDALAAKYPQAAYELAWQFVFACRRIWPNPRTGQPGRHHLHEAGVKRRSGGRPRCAGWPSGSRRTRCATRSPPTCWRTGTTCAARSTGWGNPGRPGNREEP